MADEEKKPEGEAETKPKGKKKLIIIIAVVLVLIVAGVGAFLAMSGSKEEGEEEAEETEEHAAEGEGELPGAILPLEAFIVNLQVKGSFLKTQVQLEFVTPEPPHHVEAAIPKIRDSIIKVLTSRSAGDILANEGKEKLKEEIKNSVNELLGGEEVTQVYFTEFIVQ